ncbi:MAG: hypothetical protein ACK4K7_11155 [Allosphingosinicella sp.]|uniref:hypothetical protein n=1 Tax=Allosphingosinicella sp. TaxID=2823234 RepID=UPI0039225B78
MRLPKILAGSLIAGAALALSACGGGADDTAANNQAATGIDTDPMFDNTVGNDVTAIDAAGGGTGDPLLGGQPATTNVGTGVGTQPAGNATDAAGNETTEGNTVGM